MPLLMQIEQSHPFSAIERSFANVFTNLDNTISCGRRTVVRASPPSLSLSLCLPRLHLYGKLVKIVSGTRAK